jgi:cation:H+ antiporter
MGSESGNSAFGSSILLGIVTSIPEIVTVITLLRLKNVDAAITDILGSNLFSLVIMGFVDLVTIMNQDNNM